MEIATKTGADVERVLISEQELRDKVAQLGKKISEDYAGKELMLISVLKGSVVFMADLMRAITVPLVIDFMSVSSYGAGTESSGIVKIEKDIDIDFTGKHLLVVEDILDSGMTLAYLKKLLESRLPASIRIITLLDKPARRKADIIVDYCGFEIPDEFLVGYGLDYGGDYRNLPYVGILRRDIYAETDKKS